ncbi:MAG: glycine--tRNA ligase subunit beta [Burkholderiales bacterium]|nr:glycine--tRNA ligase subunit beta [Burkholderiales bacterium]
MSAQDSKNLLVELVCEELPPKALKKLGESFASTLVASLHASGLVGANALAASFASPRRLGVHVQGVAAKAADRALQQKLMPAAVAFDKDGNASPALLKKLAALGFGPEAVPSLKRLPDGKAESLFVDSTVAGATLAEGLQKAIDETLARLPIPKVMTYQLADGWSDVRFVRPAHRLVALHGADVVPVTVLGLSAGRVTQGHRFEAKSATITVRDADSHAAQLKDEGAVIAPFAERRAEIVRQLTAAAAKQGLKPIEDDALLDEVTALVERPNVLTCQFETDFLAVPQECLILTMKANQKYFPLLDAAGKLTHKFLVVSNIRPEDPGAVIQGNERVVRPRLADAKFFFDQDRKKSLADRVPALGKVVYHGKLGSQGERVERVRQIARAIAAELGGHGLVDQADTAARLAKADLVTDMVGEFPELQGIMGGYYARHDKLGDTIADAIEDHYKPRFAGDALPRNRAGLVVALADKLETLVGLFGIGQVPTGDKDPFALRRHALGVIRMLVEAALPLDLDTLLALAVPAFGALIADPRAAVSAFIVDRLAGSLREQGYSAHEVDAVLALGVQRLADIPRRLEAVRAFAALPEAAALAAANKRIANILKKSAEPIEARADAALFSEDAERALWTDVAAVRRSADVLFEAGDYTSSLKALAALRAPVDRFFDDVMVNADDPKVRANRLGLLATLHGVMNRVADLSRLSA